MIAACRLCRLIISSRNAPRLPVPPDGIVMELSESERLQQAVFVHIAEHHEDALAKVLGAGNLLTLWAACGLVDIAAHAAAEWDAERDRQADSLMALLTDPEDTFAKGSEADAPEVTETTTAAGEETRR